MNKRKNTLTNKFWSSLGSIKVDKNMVELLKKINPDIKIKENKNINYRMKIKNVKE